MTIIQAIEMTKEDLIPRLKNERVAELVIISMLSLPERMPASFQETYTPIAAAGGTAQVSHLSRLISAQMTNAGVGVGAEKMEELKQVGAKYFWLYININ
jgi:symplekin